MKDTKNIKGKEENPENIGTDQTRTNAEIALEVENEENTEKEVVPETANPYKSKAFDLFCIWKVMPPMFKGLSSDEIEKKYFVSDEELQTLAKIKTMGEFAEMYGVGRDTLTRWNRIYMKSDVIGYAREFAKRVANSVVASTYRSSMQKDPKAHQDRKLMLNLAGFNEEHDVNIQGEGLFDILKRGLNIK